MCQLPESFNMKTILMQGKTGNRELYDTRNMLIESILVAMETDRPSVTVKLSPNICNQVATEIRYAFEPECTVSGTTDLTILFGVPTTTETMRVTTYGRGYPPGFNWKTLIARNNKQQFMELQSIIYNIIEEAGNNASKFQTEFELKFGALDAISKHRLLVVLMARFPGHIQIKSGTTSSPIYTTVDYLAGYSLDSVYILVLSEAVPTRSRSYS